MHCMVNIGSEATQTNKCFLNSWGPRKIARRATFGPRGLSLTCAYLTDVTHQFKRLTKTSDLQDEGGEKHRCYSAKSFRRDFQFTLVFFFFKGDKIEPTRKTESVVNLPPQLSWSRPVSILPFGRNQTGPLLLQTRCSWQLKRWAVGGEQRRVKERGYFRLRNTSSIYFHITATQEKNVPKYRFMNWAKYSNWGFQLSWTFSMAKKMLKKLFV